MFDVMEYGPWEMFWIGWIAGCMAMSLVMSLVLEFMYKYKKRK